ncbi:MAG TPA: DUF1579 family protein [Acidobacteriota bacterium]|jgi:hypothetical protein|nr:DUF1579 family protein [Acidobacteriota bacterium]
MIKRTIVGVVVLLFFAVAIGLAQEAGKAPKPGPEHKKLGYFIGKWSGEGDMKQSPFGPGGKFTGTETCEWFSGGFFVVCRSEGKGPMGEMKGLGILGYNPEEKKYTYHGIESTMPAAESSTGTVQGKTWNWTGESKMNGKVTKGRYIMKEISPNSYTFKYEISTDGGTWTTVMEGKDTKAGK